MKKSILNLGKTLNKVQQREINGGGNLPYTNSRDCESNNGIWYECVQQCYNSLEPHFNPCPGVL
ncbi:hypothetical protein [Tenacibaculum litoreum]|uniref:hypothetical protein n=1 Tax=Tenacibaculum litoreum TaxID=321269 RepID=UPI0038B64B43